MKTTKKLSVFLVSTALALSAVGCNVAPKKPLSQRVQNFEVTSQETVEIGQYYTPALPNATLDGKKAVVTISATQNGKDLFFNGQNALLVEDFADVTVTYTIAENGEKLEKSTLLKVQDTTAPYIVTNTLPIAVYKGETFDLTDYIRIGDLSGEVLESSIKLTDNTGAEIVATNGAFTLAEDSTVTEITIAISAKDGKNNFAEKQVKLPVLDTSLWNKPFDFENLNINKVYAKTTGATVEAAQIGDKNAVKISRTAEWVNKTAYTQAIFTLSEKISSYTCFDYMKLTVSAETNCDLKVSKATGDDLEIKRGEDGTKKHVMYIDTSLIKEANTNVVSADNFVITIAALENRTYSPVPENLEINFYVHDIEFGYNEREVAFDRPLDTTAFGIQASEVLSASFKEEGGEPQTVDLSKWLPQDGVLTLTLKKKGYRTTTVEIPIVTVMLPIGDETETENDNDVEFNW